MEWGQEKPQKIFSNTPRVHIGGPAVNASVKMILAQDQYDLDRWILYTKGPRLGPAVLYWTYVIIVVLGAILLGQISWTPLRTWHWMLLLLGLTQVNVVSLLVLVIWILVLAIRKKRILPQPSYFNLFQVGVAFMTFIAMLILITAIKQGLLGIPDMQISGNGSTDIMLNWFIDRIDGVMPQPWVLSLPMIVFRILMLLWSLWMAIYLISWLKWGWGCFSEGGLWKKEVKKVKSRKVKPEKKDKTEPPPVPDTE